MPASSSIGAAQVFRLCEVNVTRFLSSRFLAEANVDFADDVGPFLRGAKTPDELLEGGRMLWRELEPSKEVERLSEIPPVMQAPCDHRQVLDPDRDVVRALFEDRASVVLRATIYLAHQGSQT